mmetsp:Transcript_22093/g.58480  ORF Transcript_22093/g.58480 Transcript_22093/m.58480 type:complete len:114 (-) Transcript_22093:1222-1563(-)
MTSTRNGDDLSHQVLLWMRQGSNTASAPLPRESALTKKQSSKKRIHKKACACESKLKLFQTTLAWRWRHGECLQCLRVVVRERSQLKVQHVMLVAKNIVPSVGITQLDFQRIM